jgi:hypothetical protein
MNPRGFYNVTGIEIAVLSGYRTYFSHVILSAAIAGRGTVRQ